MPRNRRSVPREQRVNELVGVATELFLARGYGNTTMSGIAKAAGVANAALYWYFPTKDHLLAEVMRRAVAAEIRLLDTQPPGDDPIAHLVKGLADLRPYRQLHMTMHDRLAESEAVAETHELLLEWVRGLVRDALKFHDVDMENRDEVVELVVVVFEGLNVPGVGARAASEVILTLLRYVLRSASLPAPGVTPEMSGADARP